MANLLGECGLIEWPLTGELSFFSSAPAPMQNRIKSPDRRVAPRCILLRHTGNGFHLLLAISREMHELRRASAPFCFWCGRLFAASKDFFLVRWLQFELACLYIFAVANPRAANSVQSISGTQTKYTLLDLSRACFVFFFNGDRVRQRDWETVSAVLFYSTK